MDYTHISIIEEMSNSNEMTGAEMALRVLGGIIACIAIYFAFLLGAENIRGFIVKIIGVGIKDACIEYKEKMAAHSENNPAITGNYTDFNDSVFQEWNQQGDAINKKLFDAVGIPYINAENRNIEEARANVEGLMEAAKKCYNAGIDFGGMKELKEFSNGLR